MDADDAVMRFFDDSVMVILSPMFHLVWNPEQQNYKHLGVSQVDRDMVETIPYALDVHCGEHHFSNKVSGMPIYLVPTDPRIIDDFGDEVKTVLTSDTTIEAKSPEMASLTTEFNRLLKEFVGKMQPVKVPMSFKKEIAGCIVFKIENGRLFKREENGWFEIPKPLKD